MKILFLNNSYECYIQTKKISEYNNFSVVQKNGLIFYKGNKIVFKLFCGQKNLDYFYFSDKFVYFIDQKYDYRDPDTIVEYDINYRIKKRTMIVDFKMYSINKFIWFGDLLYIISKNSLYQFEFGHFQQQIFLKSNIYDLKITKSYVITFEIKKISIFQHNLNVIHIIQPKDRIDRVYQLFMTKSESSAYLIGFYSINILNLDTGKLEFIQNLEIYNNKIIYNDKKQQLIQFDSLCLYLYDLQNPHTTRQFYYKRQKDDKDVKISFIFNEKKYQYKIYQIRIRQD